MFRFVCPMCQHGMEVPERKAGTKTRCGRCGQKLLIPLPPQHVLGAKKKKAVAGEGGLRGLLAYSRYVVAAAVLAGFGTGGYFVYSSLTEGTAGLTVEVRSQPRNAAERSVRDTLARNVRKASDIKFEKWGPHMYRREWDSLLALAGAEGRDAAQKLIKTKNFDCVVRVVYQMPELLPGAASAGGSGSGTRDHLFVVKGLDVALLEEFPSGDDWKDRFAKNVLRQAPAGESPGGAKSK